MKLATLPSSGWRGVLAAAAVYLYCFVQTVAASQQVEQFTSLSPAPAPQLDADFAIKAATCDNLKPLGSKSEYCPYIRANCPADSIISYLEVYYCYAAPAGWLAEACICVMFALLLVLLFRVLGSTAEDYFSPILSQLSQEMGLPPRFAGVTFLALGNGAPDLSASIAAVKAGHYHLALGGLLGGGMFVGCVVAGLIVLANNGAKARGALLRDVAAYMTSVVVVALMIHSGTMTTGKAVTLLGLYVLFVLVVLGADIWHRVCGAGSQSFKELQEDLIPNPPMADLGTPTNGSPRSPSPLLLTRSGDVIPLPQRALDVELSDRSHTPSPTRHHSKLRPSRLLHHVTFGTGPAPSTGGDSFTSSEASVQASQPALSSAGPQGPRHTTLPPQRASSVPLRTSSSGVLPASIVARRMSSSGDLTYEEIRDMPARQYRARALAQMSESTSFNYRAEADIAVVIRDEEAPPVSAAATSSYQPPAVPDAAPQGPAGQHAGAGPGTGAAAAAQTAAVKPPWQQHLELVWSKLSRVGALFSSALDIAEAPLIILRKGTIPLLDPESYSRPWFLAALACAPLAMLVYLGSGDSLEAMLIALGRLPREFGYVMLGVYALYLVVNISLYAFR
ncbi:hypothetical protein WJX72_008316 [[Myrmecia] bisecta]|uniref:Sodium/calcium exchanger membrane region domain-containing protein n=1 Tax=[Myrmecia] bisecta TaxID=41462 RepID=A0AAW1R7C7_9CHLO